MKSIPCVLLILCLSGFGAVDLQNGRIGYWRMEGNLLDSSTNGMHGTAVAGPGYRAGVPGQALATTNDNGTCRYANLGHGPSITNLRNRFSVALWVYYARTNGTSRSGLVNRMGNASFNNVWNMDITEGNLNQLRFAINTNTNNTAASGSSPVSFPSNTWTHVVCTWDGTNAVVYTNGATNFTFSNTEPMNQNSVADVLAGSRGDVPGYVLNGGAIDEVCLYNRSISREEVQVLMNGILLSVNLTNQGAVVFKGQTLTGTHASSLGGALETRVRITNGLGGEVFSQIALNGPGNTWSVALPDLTSAASYTLSAVTSNAGGQGVLSQTYPFSFYNSSNVRLTVTTRDGSGKVCGGTRVYGPSTYGLWDGLRTNDSAGQVTFTGLWSGRTIALSNLAPESWGSPLAVTNLVVPEVDGTLEWTLSTSAAVVASAETRSTTSRAAWGGSRGEPWVFPMAIKDPMCTRVLVQAIPLAGGARCTLFDDLVTGQGDAVIQVPAKAMKSLVKPGVWLVEARFPRIGLDDSVAETRRTLLFVYP